jgi:hypothetical protein
MVIENEEENRREEKITKSKRSRETDGIYISRRNKRYPVSIEDNVKRKSKIYVLSRE